MNRFLSSERSRWLFFIGLVAIGSGVSYSLLTHSCDPEYGVSIFERNKNEAAQNKLDEFVMKNPPKKNSLELSPLER